jgi:hypothetical protein
MNAVVRHDWPTIIAEIKAAYEKRRGRKLSDHKLGLMVGVDSSSIERLQAVEKSQPKHHTGELLLAVHSEYSLENSSMCHVKP